MNTGIESINQSIQSSKVMAAAYSLVEVHSSHEHKVPSRSSD